MHRVVGVEPHSTSVPARARIGGVLLVLVLGWLGLGATPANSAPVATTLAYRAERIQALNDSALKLARSDPDRATTMANEALLAATSAHDQRGRIEALHNLGRIARLRGDLQQAASTLRGAEAEARKLGDLALVAQLGNSLGVTYELQGLEAEALELHQQVLATWKTLGDPAGVIASMINIGKVFESRRDYQNARVQFQKAREQVAALAPDQSIPAQDRAAIWLGLARLDLQLGKVQPALVAITSALAIQRQNDDRIGQASALAIKARALERSFDNAAALVAYQQALDLASSVGDKTTITEILTAIGRMQLNRLAKMDTLAQAPRLAILNEALAYTERAFRLADSINNSALLMPIHQQLADIYEARGELARALVEARAYTQSRERWFSEQSRARYDLLASRYQAEERERELGRLRDQSELSQRLIAREQVYRRVLVVAVVLALLLAAVLGFRFWERERVNEQLRQVGDQLRTALSAAEQAQTRAEEADRFKTEMLGMAAHDLRNPLGTILGFADLIRADQASAEDIQRYATIIATATQRTLRMLGDLLESAALDAGRVVLHPLTLDLHQLLNEAIERQRERAAAKGQQIVLIASGEASVEADPERLQQVLDNLLGNAIKFSPLNGRIEVLLSVAEQQVSIAIRDDGPGFRREDEPRLFQRFQRLSARPTAGETSTGLGLAIVKDLVELHGGTVRASSAGPGLGATFTVQLSRRTATPAVSPMLISPRAEASATADRLL